MSQEENLLLQDLALRGFQLEANLDEFLYGELQSAEMLVIVSIAEHNQVIQVDEKDFPLDSSENHLHARLEGTRRWAEPEGEFGIFKQAILGGDGCFLPVPLVNLQLEVTTLEITHREQACRSETLMTAVYAGQGIGIFAGQIIDPSEVPTPAYSGVCLPY